MSTTRAIRRFWWETSAWFASMAWRSRDVLERAIETLDQSGQTALILVRDGQVLGVIGARDRVRGAAHDVIHDLKHLGLKDLAILTGDRAAPARAVAKKVHIQQVESELTPAAKADWIEQKRRDGRVVAMVGDGINDAPALARADVGLALAGVGGDLAAEAGSVVLLGDPLPALPETIRLARQTVRIIRQNILLLRLRFQREWPWPWPDCGSWAPSRRPSSTRSARSWSC